MFWESQDSRVRRAGSSLTHRTYCWNQHAEYDSEIASKAGRAHHLVCPLTGRALDPSIAPRSSPVWAVWNNHCGNGKNKHTTVWVMFCFPISSLLQWVAQFLKSHQALPLWFAQFSVHVFYSIKSKKEERNNWVRIFYSLSWIETHPLHAGLPLARGRAWTHSHVYHC